MPPGNRGDVPEHASDHQYDLDPEYLYPSDAQVLSLEDSGDGLVIEIAIPCPECDQALRLTTAVTDVSEAGFDLPVDDDFHD